MLNYSKERLYIPLTKDITEEQTKLVEEFKAKVEAEWQQITPPVDELYFKQLDPYTYQRFLAARSWDIKNAYEMLKNCLIWRTENKVSEIKFEDVEPEFKKGKAFYHGYDSKGQLVCWIRVHLHISSTSDWDTMQKTCIWLMEESYHCANIDSPCAFVIFDLSNFSITKNMDYKLVKFLISMFQNYYPETLGICVVLNAPWLFSGCWKLIRPFVDQKTAEKVHFMKYDELKELLPEERLFEDIGGQLAFEFNDVYEEIRDNFISRSTEGKKEEIEEGKTESETVNVDEKDVSKEEELKTEEAKPEE